MFWLVWFFLLVFFFVFYLSANFGLRKTFCFVSFVISDLLFCVKFALILHFPVTFSYTHYQSFLHISRDQLINPIRSFPQTPQTLWLRTRRSTALVESRPRCGGRQHRGILRHQGVSQHRLSWGHSISAPNYTTPMCPMYKRFKRCLVYDSPTQS